MLNQQVKRAPEIAVGEALSSAAMEMINSGRMSLGEVLDEFEQIVLREALARNSGSYTDLAERLGLSRRTFYNKLRKYNLSSESRPLD